MSTKIRTLIIDDEKHCRETLNQMVDWYCPDIEVIAQCKNAAEAEVSIKELKPDLIFLDIEMPKKDGLSLVQDLHTIDFEIIFTTAYDKFAIDAFKIDALDYLLKPVLKDDLMHAVSKVKDSMEKNLTQEKILKIHNMILSSSGTTKVAIPTSEGMEFLKITNIIRCESDGNYTHVFLENDKPLFVSKTLKQITEIINSPEFIRPHNSHLVNINFIRRYKKGAGGSLELEDGTIIPVSRQRKNSIKF